MTNRRKSSGQRATPKLFRCSGYGNCDMVFTRSEHLARHERKHTGEKPYKCVVPGCGRMFSRFDNMMQHTQTHEKTKKAPPCQAEKMKAKTSQQGVPTLNMTPIKTEQSYWTGQQRNMSDLIMATSFVPPPGNSFIMNSRTLPVPTRRASFSSYNNDPYPTSNYRLSHPHDPPGTFYNGDVSMQAYNIPGNRSSWPIRRETFHNIKSYKPPPSLSSVQFHNIEGYNNYMRRRSSASTASSNSTLISPVLHQYPQDPHITRRRISINDLRLPIENLKNIQLDDDSCNNHYDNNSVDITSDEFEALEGFSKFRSGSVITKETPSPITEPSPSPVSRSQSPTIAAQVCAMRQRIMTTNESFQRR